MNTLGRLGGSGQLSTADTEALERLQAAHQKGYLWDTGYTDLVPERWIDRFAVAGTPDEVRARLERTLADGADEIGLILMSAGGAARGSADQLALFAETVMAPLRAAREVAAWVIGSTSACGLTNHGSQRPTAQPQPVPAGDR